MNRFLVNILGALNIIAAVVIITVGASYGAAIAKMTPRVESDGAALIGAIVGGIIGCIGAGMVCGVISLLILIERHLRTLAAQRGALSTSQTGRKEPSF
jgi:hypothetical protein